jgi:hypothetical protein
VSSAHLWIGSQRPVGSEIYQNAHNILLDLALWGGIPLAAVVLAIALYWARSNVTRFSDTRNWALLLATAAICVHALTEYPLDFAYFVVALGFLVGTITARSPAHLSWTAPRWCLLGPWAVLMAMLVWIGIEYMHVEEASRQTRLALAGVVRKHGEIPPLPSVVLLDAPREYQKLWSTPARRNMDTEQIEWMRAVVWRHPYPPALMRYALAAGLNGRPEEAAATLRVICNLQPVPLCDGARQDWRTARQLYPELQRIALP